MSVIHPSGLRATDRFDRRPPSGSPPFTLPDDPARGAARADTWAPAWMIQRVALLERTDRTMIELTLRSGLSRADVARAMNLSAGYVSRRFRLVYARLHDPLVAALFDPRCPLAPEYRQLALEHFLQGATAPALAEKHRMPAEQVRKMLTHVRWWHRGVSAGRAGTSTRTNPTSQPSAAAGMRGADA